jgi:hypothetical protein
VRSNIPYQHVLLLCIFTFLDQVHVFVNVQQVNSLIFVYGSIILYLSLLALFTNIHGLK